MGLDPLDSLCKEHSKIRELLRIDSNLVLRKLQKDLVEVEKARIKLNLFLLSVETS